MTPKNAREKGKRFEKQILHWLQSLGLRAQRLEGQKDQPDIRVELDGRCLFIEAKHHKKVRWRGGFEQALKSKRGPSDLFAVVAKDNRADEVWILPKEAGELFFEMLKERCNGDT